MDVLTLGHPGLHRRAAEVIDFGSLALEQDIELLQSVMREQGGMGIAAPQLGMNRRLLLIHSKPNARYPHAPHSEFMVLINPVFQQSIDEEEAWEGCLSVPGLRGLVSRATKVSIKYESVDGGECSVNLTDFLARIFLHEYDHLEGWTFLDRIESSAKLMSTIEYFRQFPV